jgi:hypothetical protein
MSTRRSLVFGLAALALAETLRAGPIDYLFRDERVCDEDRDFCMVGTLSYRINPRLLRLRARVQKAPGPGLLRIRLRGETRQGFQRLAPMELRLRGKPTEIINHKIIPDHPDAEFWTVQRVEFVVDSD